MSFVGTNHDKKHEKKEKKKKSMNQVRLSFLQLFLMKWHQLRVHLLRCAYAHLLTSQVRFAPFARQFFFEISWFLSITTIYYKFVRFLGVLESACRLGFRGVSHD